MNNKLYYADNLPALRDYIADESIDLIYLDPPFNSGRNYNVLFKEANGSAADAQIMAFEDAWTWGPTAEETLRELEETADPRIVEMIQAVVGFVGRCDMTAYLVMMTIRLIELHRVLKPTGSLYLHCDPTASHYLKIVLDTVFGPAQFRNEIVWRRTGAKGTTRKFAAIHEIIFFYSKTKDYYFQPTYGPYTKQYIEDFFKYTEAETGRRYQKVALTAPGSNMRYEFKGVTPRSRGWCWTQERMEQADRDGLIVQTKPGTQPRQKQYLDKSKGTQHNDLWTYSPGTKGCMYGNDSIGINEDVRWLSSQAAERLGFPTQKPEGLLERIINASSKPGDVVLDPFCGCGTTVAAAQKLGREWIGIDVTCLATALIESRLHDMYGDEAIYEVIGIPVSVLGAIELAKQDRFQFEWWALSLIKARPAGGKKKGADRGVDGILFLADEAGKKGKKVVVQVKSGHVQSSHIRDLRAVVDREKAAMGFLITLESPTKPMRKEALSAGYYHSPGWNQDYQKIQIRTVEQLLNEETFDKPPTDPSWGRAKRVRPGARQDRLI